MRRSGRDGLERADAESLYSGDTALHPQFAEIGARLGPFDVTLMESGAYNQLWADVHLGPEQAVIAHRMVGGNVMILVHWGFDLALHGWTEPAERAAAAAERLGVDVAILRLRRIVRSGPRASCRPMVARDALGAS